MDLRLVTPVSATLTNQHDRRLEWNLVQSQMPHKFLPFSRYVFIDMNNILVLGGLDDTHTNINDFFTNYVYQLSVKLFNRDDEMYVCKPKSAMLNGRGCFGVCINTKFVYVFGGVTGGHFNQLSKIGDEEQEDSR